MSSNLPYLADVISQHVCCELRKWRRRNMSKRGHVHILTKLVERGFRVLRSTKMSTLPFQPTSEISKARIGLVLSPTTEP